MEITFDKNYGLGNVKFGYCKKVQNQDSTRSPPPQRGQTIQTFAVRQSRLSLASPTIASKKRLIV